MLSVWFGCASSANSMIFFSLSRMKFMMWAMVKIAHFQYFFFIGFHLKQGECMAHTQPIRLDILQSENNRIGFSRICSLGREILKEK